MFLFLIILYNKDTILLIGLNIRTVIEALTLVILKKIFSLFHLWHSGSWNCTLTLMLVFWNPFYFFLSNYVILETLNLPI